MSFVSQLRPQVAGRIAADLGSRLAYAVDASPYRVTPHSVLVAHDEQDLEAALAMCRETGTPLTVRGAGTGMAGQSLGTGLVVDCSMLNRVVMIDPDSRLARVQPGVVQSDLDRAAGHHGLCLGPDTASAGRATMGGMVANDSAGMRSVIYGRTSHSVRRLRVLRSDGTVEWVGKARREQLQGPWRAAVDVAEGVMPEIDQRWPRLLRCVDGYNLPALTGPIPDVARFLCGSEGTLAIILEIELELAIAPERRAWTVVPVASLAHAADLAPQAVANGASAVELIDAPTLASDRFARELASSGTTLLLVEHSGSDESVRLARATLTKLAPPGTRHIDDRDDAAALVQMRRNLLALTSRRSGRRRPTSVHEDGAVPPDRVHEYLEGLHAIFRQHGTDSATTGHISVGCLHTQPLLDLEDPRGLQAMRAIAEQAADLVASLGGAISGEHGDGIARSELLPRLFGDKLCRSFAEVKAAIDPHNLLNPGKIVSPWPLDHSLRISARTHKSAQRTEVENNAMDCIGIAACRDRLAGTMCPPFRVLRAEASATRGMANLLREAIDGHLPADDPQLPRALDLCVGCKGCRVECPAGVDMAWMKAWHRSTHPPSGLSDRLRQQLFGSLPRLLGLGGRAPGLTNAAMGLPGTRSVGHAVGVHRARKPPRIARRSLRALTTDRRVPTRPDVVMFVDEFTNHFEPEVGLAALRYLDAAGVSVALAPNVCCGRTYISAGMLDRARKLAVENIHLLGDFAAAGIPIIGLEPSCILTFRDELPRLLQGDDRATLLAEQSFLLEELLPRVNRPELKPAEQPYVVHPHCHAKAAGAGRATQGALELIPSSEVVTLDAGCCGMAGSFGYRRESYELSLAIANDRLIPQLRGHTHATVVANGTSCRTQIYDVAGIAACHPVSVLAEQLR